MKNFFKQLVKLLFQPEEKRGQLFYYGTMFYILLNFLVKDEIALISTAILVLGIELYNRIIKLQKWSWVDVIFGIIPALLISIEIWI